MSTAQARVAIMRHEIKTAHLAGRAERLVEAIKAETRWQLLTLPERRFLDYRADRAAFVRTWPGIRHRRVPADELVWFHDIVADQASTLAHLIAARRDRTFNRKSQ